MMSVTDIEVIGEKVYATTTGGLLVFNPASDEFTKVTNIEGLSHTDLTSMIVDKNDMLWIATGAPVGDINIWEPDRGIHKTIPLDQSAAVSINHLVQYENEVFGAATRNLENNVVHFNQPEPNEYDFKDFYNQFPVSFGSIQDIAVFRDRIYLATDMGLIRTKELLSSNPNLKAGSAWNKVSPDSNYIELAVTGDVLNIADERTVWQYDGSSFLEIPISQSTSTLLKLQSLDEQLFLGARNGLFMYSGGNWSKLVSQSIPITAIAQGKEGILWGGTRGYGIIQINQSADTTELFQPNGPFDNEFSAMAVSNNGQLIAARTQGIAIYDDGRWTNYLNYGKWPDRKFFDQLLSNQRTDEYWSADSMVYQSARPYEVVISKDNQAFVSHEGQGVLHLDLNDIHNYEVYDTTDGHLSGSEGIGSGSANFIITRDITLDHQENLWIGNAFAANGNALTTLTPDGRWMHFNIANPNIQGKLNLLPTEIAVDQQNRIWIASARKEDDPKSNGGIAVLDFNGTLTNQSDDRWIWLNITTNGLAGMTVYSITITSDNIAYIVTDGDKRVQKYRIPTELPANRSEIYFQTDRVDELIGVFPLIESERDVRNNIWFISANNGIKMRTARGELLNDAQGYSTDNSPLLSNNVYAIESAHNNGITYFATDFGISAVTTQYAEPRPDFSDISTYPSPYYIPNEDNMIIDELPDDSEVKILTVTGQVVRTLTPNEGTVKNRQAFWDGTNESGDLVGSGVYFVYCYTQNGEVKTTKALVVRQ